MCNERHDDGPRRLALEPESTADKVGRVVRCKDSHVCRLAGHAEQTCEPRYSGDERNASINKRVHPATQELLGGRGKNFEASKRNGLVRGLTQLVQEDNIKGD